jgi:hypothetical protein
MVADTPTDKSGTEDGGKMLARTWSIAGNFRTPEEYGIPTAPSFETEREADGTVRFLASDGSTVAVLAGEGSRVRR